MEFIMDMVHDNPGEPKCQTSFKNPEKLLRYGYNTKVFRLTNTTISFEKLGQDFFCEDGAKEWLADVQKTADDEISRAHEAGLMTMTHIDLFVLPKLLVQKYQNELCNEEGNISVFRSKTKEIHRIMFDELFERYPLDGLIIRVGENYLHDSPYHTGSCAVTYGDVTEEKKAFIELIRFLREEVCVKHGKYLVFRTWDCFSDKFHSNLDYYMDVTNKIEPCEKLIFSIKHTALDFWRSVKFNECIGIGNHKQIIEVQCQREYEGKGAYPSYVMDGVINYFPENKKRKGLRDVVDNTLICGIFTWSRGGGWFGPYIKNEFWCDLNAYVICKYAQNPKRSEEDIFFEYTKSKMGLDTENAQLFRELCLRASEAVLYGRYIEAYDVSLNESLMPCGNWMRDDRIGGLRQLGEVFDYLEKNNVVYQALEEKKKALRLWKEIKNMFMKINIEDYVLKEFIGNSIDYAVLLFEIIYISFKIFIKYREHEYVPELIKEYDSTWESFKSFEQCPHASTSYCEEYIFSENNLGLNETIANYRAKNYI